MSLGTLTDALPMRLPRTSACDRLEHARDHRAHARDQSRVLSARMGPDSPRCAITQRDIRVWCYAAYGTDLAYVAIYLRVCFWTDREYGAA
eukprot:868532-Rhodomonas_salina.2